jgi:hypothetical protein
MTKTVLILMALAGLAITHQAQASIGWTLDQCKAKYGTANPTERGENLPEYLREKYVFNVSGFRIVVAIGYGVVSAIVYEPENPLSQERGKEILSKNYNTKWEPDDVLGNEPDVDVLKTNSKNKHDLIAMFHLS